MRNFLEKGPSQAFLDVKQYPMSFLKITDGIVQIPVKYKSKWDDDFAVRGWKVNATIGDPTIIASTRETGQRINTSVLVHDILDHFLSGFGVSGHRSEAMALIQLAKRTDSSPASDYEQIVREDMMIGRINGESFMTFLPNQLTSLLPVENEMSETAIINFLLNKMGKVELVAALVERFFTIGMMGEQHALTSYEKLGLDKDKRKEVGLSLQGLLQIVDEKVEASDVEDLDALISISNEKCSFEINSHGSKVSDAIFHANVT